MLRAVSLFSNCGAGDVGYNEAGFNFEVMAELDERRLEVCLLNHEGAEGVPGDLRETHGEVVEKWRERHGQDRPSLLTACPPCQGMSSARGARGDVDDPDDGMFDERNVLVVVIERVARALRPELIVVENVPVFLRRKVRDPDTGEGVSAARLLIERLRGEYAVFPLLCDLADYGVPQTRKRSFLTFARQGRRACARLRESGRAPYTVPTHATDHDGEEQITLRVALESFGLSELDAKENPDDEERPLHFVPEWGAYRYGLVSSIEEGSGKSAWENTCPDCPDAELGENDARCPECGEVLPRPVVKEDDGTYRLVKGFRTSSYRRMRPDEPSSTITTASGHLGSHNTIHPFENRLFSALECAKLQTFDACRPFEWGEALEKWGHTNVREMVGEAVPPKFTFQHGSALASLLSDEWDPEASPAELLPKDDVRCTKAWQKLEMQQAMNFDEEVAS